MVYAYAGLHRLYQRFDRRTIWDQLEKRAEPDGKAREQAAKPPARESASKRTGFTTNW
jgi:hypothetical protein